MTIYASVSAFLYCCGVTEVGEFNTYEEAHSLKAHLNDPWIKYSTGMCVSTFIDGPVQKAAYEIICKKCEVLYQSPVFVNKSTGNGVFLLVYKVK